MAEENRPDLRTAIQSVTAAKSQLSLAESNGVQDLTVSADYVRSPLGGDKTANTAAIGHSIPFAIFNRNRGEIARTRVAVKQAELQEASVFGQVMTEVRDAYEGLQRNNRIAQHYRSGYLEGSQKSRDISECAYKPTNAAPPACSIFSTPNVATARRRSVTARPWPPTCSPSSKFARPWGQGGCRELARCKAVDPELCTTPSFLCF